MRGVILKTLHVLLCDARKIFAADVDEAEVASGNTATSLRFFSRIKKEKKKEKREHDIRTGVAVVFEYSESFSTAMCICVRVCVGMCVCVWP